MEQRKELILNTIIKEYIKTGAPVGSSILVNKYKLNISSATVRNVMSDLEEAGFICQPYTSAGRVPTELAYNLYLKNLKSKKLSENKISLLKNNLQNLNIDSETKLKKTAKIIAELSQNAVFWAIHRHNLYYTGISNLFQQPEFTQTNLVYDISVIIDRMEEIIDEIFDDLKDGSQIMIGSKNPFGAFCGTILVKYKLKNNTGLFGILGPMRMDYASNLGVVEYTLSQLKIDNG